MCDFIVLSLVATASGGGWIVDICCIGATTCCWGGTRIPPRIEFLFGSGALLRGAINTGFFLAGIGLSAGGFDLREEEMSTKGATLAVFRSTFL